MLPSMSTSGAHRYWQVLRAALPLQPSPLQPSHRVGCAPTLLQKVARKGHYGAYLLEGAQPWVLCCPQAQS